MKKFQNCKVVIEDSTLLKLLYFISQMKSLRTWMTNTYLLDMSKAFNSIRHDLIPSKRQSIGVSNGACDWFGSYLSQRSQVVNMANSISDPSSVTVGVLQGSITGPVLFSFYVNDLLLVPAHCHAMGYVEDTKNVLSAFPQIIFQMQLFH